MIEEKIGILKRKVEKGIRMIREKTG